jgi:hypothetical protein
MWPGDVGNLRQDRALLAQSPTTQTGSRRFWRRDDG